MAAAASNFPCVYCRATLPLAAPRCPYCLLAYAHGPAGSPPGTTGAPRPWLPPVRPGMAVSSLNFAEVPPPNMGKDEVKLDSGSSTSRSPQGCLATVAAKRALTLTESRLRMKDGCVRAQMTALDPGAIIAMIARQERIGEITSQYTFEVVVSRRRVRLTRTVSSAKQASGTNLLEWIDCPAVAGVGQPNVLELRVMGPTLEAWVNGAGPFSVHDPVLGTGIFGIRLEHDDTQPAQARRVQVAWLQVLEVIA